MELSEIKGIGEKRLTLLKKAGISSSSDLLLHFPLFYIDTTIRVNFASLHDGDKVGFLGEFVARKVIYIRKGLSRTNIDVMYSGQIVKLVWFNQPFIGKQLKVNEKYIFFGAYKPFSKTFSIQNAMIIAPISGKTVYPIYQKIKGLPDSVITQAIKTVFSKVKVMSWFEELEEIDNLETSFSEVHFPTSIFKSEIAKQNISFCQLLYMICCFNIAKQNEATRQPIVIDERKLENLVKSLPYELTESQKNAIESLKTDFRSKTTANVLLQGDVGSGKTIVALLCMYMFYCSGYQAVFLAPTEILASQHYITARKLMGNDIEMTLLCSGNTKFEREKALETIASRPAIIIGTHSLLSESVIYHNLGLVITDEQHKFGVNQRSKLENKAEKCDKIVLSATPIPRTLALALYGRLEKIVLQAPKKERGKTTTKFVPQDKIEGMFDYIAQKAKNNEQSYIVCARIDDDEDMISATSLYKKLKKKQLKDINVALLHGKIDEQEKNRIMAEYANGAIKVLIATTVIEVGIDVKNATTIAIFDSDRYGLSQLHQLRGRVGRGNLDSYCFLLTDNDNSETRSRLQYLCENNDGFALAEYDLKIRGAGDFLGIRQHGDNNVILDKATIDKAMSLAEDVLLDENMVKEIKASMTIENSDFMRSITLN